MSNEEKAPLVPRLRFSEFLATEGWEPKSVGAYLVDCRGRVASDTDLPIYSSTREGLKRQDAYFDGSVLQNDNDYGIVPAGSFVYRHMSDDGLFRFNINSTGGDIAVSKEYPVFRTRGLDSRLLLALLNDSPDFRKFAYSQKAGGTRTRLYFSRLCEWQTPLPTIAEQKKIADCLTSLDELIAAQARQVDALKAHRESLMQQLLPSEGGTRPRMRFPEFLSLGDWELAVLNDVCVSIASGKDKVDAEGQFHLYGSTGAIGKTKKATFEGSYILVARVGANAGYLNKVAGKFGVTDNTLVLELQRLEQLDFVFLCLQKIGLNKLIFGSGQPLITGGQLKALAVALPPDAEQQRIASVFISLDDQINAAAQELEALKTHKKGLMQQLFPSAETLDA